MVDKIYCGINPVPKGSQRGTAKQCYNRNQIRYYGTHIIDKNLLKEKKVNDYKKKIYYKKNN